MGDNTSNILVQRLFVLFGNEGFPALNSEDNVDVKLGIVLAMMLFRRGPLHLSPRWGLGVGLCHVFYTPVAPLVLEYIGCPAPINRDSKQSVFPYLTDAQSGGSAACPSCRTVLSQGIPIRKFSIFYNFYD